MKKKNWLLTIAFAFVALAIVSTTVLGSTYAKYTTTIGAEASAQAAGFLITAGANETSEATVLLAPGVTFSVAKDLSYFSQVETTLTLTNQVVAANNTGVFTTANWEKIIAYYNAYVASDNDHKVASDLAVSQVITVSGTTAANIAALIYNGQTGSDQTGYSQGSGVNANRFEGTYTTGATLPAMKRTETTAIAVNNVDLSISWVSQKVGSTEVDNDEFDTFLGNCIAKMALADSTSVTVMTVTVAQVGEVPLTLTLTGAAAHQTSTIATAITLRADQVTD